MSKVVTAVLAFIVLFALFLMFNTILPQFVLKPLSENANTTITGTSGYINLNSWYNNFLWSTLPKIFGICSVFSGIAIIIAYFLETHRFESEQYSYYNDNKYLR